MFDSLKLQYNAMLSVQQFCMKLIPIVLFIGIMAYQCWIEDHMVWGSIFTAGHVKKH